MNYPIKALSLAVLTALSVSPAIANETTDEKVAKLEQQVQALQAQQNKSLTEKFNFNGFISGAYISSDNSAGYLGATTSADFSQDSKIGFKARLISATKLKPFYN